MPSILKTRTVCIHTSKIVRCTLKCLLGSSWTQALVGRASWRKTTWRKTAKIFRDSWERVPMGKKIKAKKTSRKQKKRTRNCKPARRSQAELLPEHRLCSFVYFVLLFSPGFGTFRSSTLNFYLVFNLPSWIEWIDEASKWHYLAHSLF